MARACREDERYVEWRQQTFSASHVLQQSRIVVRSLCVRLGHARSSLAIE